MAQLSELTERRKKMPRFRLGEMGTVGLKVYNGHILEEERRDLRWPKSIYTFKVMSRDSTVASAITLIETLIRRVDWQVIPPKGEEANAEEYQERMDFFESCMHDMEEDWGDFINDILSMLVYGFSIHEKVYKKRQGDKGKYESEFDDGLIGWAKLPIRSQDSIDKWYFEDYGREFVGCRQNLSLVQQYNPFEKPLKSKYVHLPKQKFLHFRYDQKRGNPEGRSPLINCYVPWHYKSTIEEYEAMGVSRDLAGMPVIKLPVEYFDEDASDDKKRFVEYCKRMINEMNANERSGVLFPKFVDPETKEDVFDFELIGVTGGKNYDTDKIIHRYESQILMAFLADVLKLGQDSVGSFALADNKTNTLSLAIESILKQIVAIINKDLVKQTYELNQWSGEKRVRIVHGDLESIDLDAMSKYIQRIVSVGAMEVDKGLSERLREFASLPPANPDEPIDDELTPQGKSRAGDGMATPGEGTKQSTTGQDDPDTGNNES